MIKMSDREKRHIEEIINKLFVLRLKTGSRSGLRWPGKKGT